MIPVIEKIRDGNQEAVKVTTSSCDSAVGKTSFDNLPQDLPALPLLTALYT